MFDRLLALETFGIKLGLENIERLCRALDHPEQSFTALHVAGTNGKESVTAMVHAALVAAGIPSGRYTSPHLTHLRERFVVGRAAMNDAAVEAAANTVLDCAERLRREGTMIVSPTFFEATTAMAFEVFRHEGVQVAVVEVGLGGRFDATNILTPLVGAITSIALDHQEHLGDTLGQIAFEKAGIVKPGMTLVTGALPQAARLVIGRIVEEQGAVMVEAGTDVRVNTRMADGRAHVTIDTPGGRYGPLRLALRGEHQVGNALVAIRMLEAAHAAGVEVSADAVAEGLETVEWPARLELLTLTDGRQILLDAAHNPEGARALRAYLERWHPDAPTLVVGIMADKDIDAILGELMPATSSVIVTAADTPRAMPAHELAARVSALDPSRPVRTCTDVPAAVEAMLDGAQTTCVAGSIFLAGAVRDALKRRDILQ